MERGAACVGMGWKWMGWDMDGIERGTAGTVGTAAQRSRAHLSAPSEPAQGTYLYYVVRQVRADSPGTGSIGRGTRGRGPCDFSPCLFVLHPPLTVVGRILF